MIYPDIFGCIRLHRLPPSKPHMLSSIGVPLLERPTPLCPTRRHTSKTTPYVNFQKISRRNTTSRFHMAHGSMERWNVLEKSSCAHPENYSLNHNCQSIPGRYDSSHPNFPQSFFISPAKNPLTNGNFYWKTTVNQNKHVPTMHRCNIHIRI